MKPILFNTEMVKAILEGRKTVTRRIIKPQPVDTDCKHEMVTFNDMIPEHYKGDYSCACRKCGWGVCKDGESVFQPPYRPGDILYVRETWRVQSAHRFEADAKIEFKAGGPMTTIQFSGRCSDSHERKDYDSFITKWWNAAMKWKPSIFMPKEAARIFLRVTHVRVERLQDITADEAMNEGFSDWNHFVSLWDSTVPRHPNKFKSYPYYWKDNPWVWVIEFERCEKPKEEDHEQ